MLNMIDTLPKTIVVDKNYFILFTPKNGEEKIIANLPECQSNTTLPK